MGDARRAPSQALYGRRQAAHELIIIVGVQNIVFAVVLGCAQPDRRSRAARRNRLARPRLRRRRRRRSRPSRDRHRRDRRDYPSRPRRSGPAGRRHTRRASSRTRGRPPGAVPLRGPYRRLRARCAGYAHWRQSDWRRQARRASAMARTALPMMSIWVGKASRNSPETRKVTSTRGRFSSRQRRDRKARDAARGLLPHRPRADQRQRLGDIVAAGAHVGGAPGRQRNRARPFACLLPVALRPDARPRGCPIRQADGVGTARTSTAKKLRPVGSTSGRPRVGAPDGPGRTNRPSSPRSKALISAPPQASMTGRSLASIQPSTAPGAAPRRRSQGRTPDDQPKREQFDPLHGVARGAPRVGADIAAERQDAARRNPPPRSRVKRIEIAKAEIERQRAMQRGVLRLHVRTRQPRDRDQKIVSLAFRRRRRRTHAGHRESAFP